jgi:purine-binding chemotaxis protein CheW
MSQPLLKVRVGPYGFGAPIGAVVEILGQPTVTPLPRMPSVVAGMAVVRGQPLAVLTLRPVIGLEGEAAPLALRWQTAQGAVLVTVDQVDALGEAGPTLPAEAWAGLVPPRVLPWIRACHPAGDGWLWEWPPDLPTLLLRAAGEGTGGGGGAG